MHIRITCEPVQTAMRPTIILTVDGFTTPHGLGNKIFQSKCYVEMSPHGTAYSPIPPAEAFNTFPQEYDDHIRMVVNAYLDAMAGRASFSWAYDKEKEPLLLQCDDTPRRRIVTR